MASFPWSQPETEICTCNCNQGSVLQLLRLVEDMTLLTWVGDDDL